MEIIYYLCDICGYKDQNADHIAELYYSNFYDDTDNDEVIDETMHICKKCYEKYIKLLKGKELK